MQVQISINNYSFTVKKDHLVSLKVTRVIGDAANEFSLEVFDETAWQLENALMLKNGSASTDLASISVKYSAANDLNKSVTFSGTCLNYQMSFVGKASMLTITGVLATSIEQAGWWFTSQAIEWCGATPTLISDGADSSSEQNYMIDGKSYDTWSNYQSNQDVCAIVKIENGAPKAYFNPSRIFQRIIHTYNGDKLGSTSSGNMGSYTTNLSTSNVALSVWQFFRQHGFSEESTAGIMGNIQQESSMDPSKLQNGRGPAAGLFQMENYNDKNGRFKELVDFAAQRGKPWSDLQVQLEWFISDSPGAFKKQIKTYSTQGRVYKYDNGTVTWWPTPITMEEFKQLKDINLATEIFERTFERPSVPLREKRKAYARNFYDLYKSTQASTTASTSLVGQKLTLSIPIEQYLIPQLASTTNETIPAGTTVTVGQYSGNYCYVTWSDKHCWVLVQKLTASATVQDKQVTMNYTTSSGTAVDGWGTGGTGNFPLGDVDESRWIAGLNTNQSSGETAAQYITNTLCKAAVSNTGVSYSEETAGFRYFIDKNGHNFKRLTYADATEIPSFTLVYGQKDSNIISFSVTNLGSLAMVGVSNANKDSIDTSSFSYLYGDLITSGGDNILDAGVSDDVIKSNAAYTNWYDLQQKARSVYVSSSSTEQQLASIKSNTWDQLSQICFSAELTVWGDYSDKYTPGGYIDISIIGPSTKEFPSGVKHYASGVYMILQIQDSVSAEGFTQTMKLLKNPSKAGGTSSTVVRETKVSNTTKSKTLTDEDIVRGATQIGANKVNNTGSSDYNLSKPTPASTAAQEAAIRQNQKKNPWSGITLTKR